MAKQPNAWHYLSQARYTFAKKPLIKSTSYYWSQAILLLTEIKIAQMNSKEKNIWLTFEGKYTAVATIRNFKGLEADVVFILDTNKMEKEDKRVLYTQASRARLWLGVFGKG